MHAFTHQCCLLFSFTFYDTRSAWGQNKTSPHCYALCYFYEKIDFSVYLNHLFLNLATICSPGKVFVCKRGSLIMAKVVNVHPTLVITCLYLIPPLCYFVPVLLPLCRQSVGDSISVHPWHQSRAYITSFAAHQSRNFIHNQSRSTEPG